MTDSARRPSAPRLALAAACALPLAAAPAPRPAAAQEGGGLPELLDQVNLFSLRLAVLALRDMADVTYAAVQSDLRAGESSIVGLRINPTYNPDFPDYGHDDDAPDCTIDIGRMDFSGLPWDQMLGDAVSGAVAVSDIEVAVTCLPPMTAIQLSTAGIPVLRFERAEIDYTYDLRSSALEVAATLSATGLADIRVDAGFDYVWVQSFGGNDPAPTLALRRAAVRIDDQGLTKAARPFMGAAGLSPDRLGDLATAQLRNALKDETGEVTPGLEALPVAAGDALRAYFAQKGGLEFSVDPGRSFWLDLEDSPLDQLAGMNPALRHVPPGAVSVALDPEMLRAAMAAQAAGAPAPALPRDEALALARALVDGIGAPYNPALAHAALRPLAAGGDPEALRLVAEVLERDDPAEAYAAALKGFGAGDLEADPVARGRGTALLDGLERELGLSAALALQAAARGETAAEEAAADPAALRRMAAAMAEGRGRPRDYLGAYRLATLSAALGDAGGAALRARLDRRLRVRGDAWAAAADGARAAASEAWLARGGK